ncbi:MAG: hypothetical protein WAO76_13125, partial [Georgfuchsia sp.]
AWAEVTEVKPESLLECLQTLLSEIPETIAERVLRGQEIPNGMGRHETPVAALPPMAELEPALLS